MTSSRFNSVETPVIYYYYIIIIYYY